MSTATASALPEEHPAARSARVRRDAADRARRWRETQRETAETDAAIVKAMLADVDAYITPEHRLMARNERVDIAFVVGRAAYELGGRERFKEAKKRVFDRLQELSPAPKHHA
ncbi:hypothetical protein MKK50_15705 [Methylobacterium sp. J-043]|uniref:Uncharacterized protein n=1 Tax=Methylobacterium goesingense TaxID=243690 RepID=A0ABV2LB50_9HYPH|nr:MULTISPECIES: hypothetical protein [Methylobacteriaceae]MCJ2030817.1 hypothetical protein [Methylobacterium sp. J-043]UYW33819.1 hypothetical protein OKB92_06990 [Methylorubrum extorquens]